MFFAYNNGIAATASDVVIEKVGGAAFITEITALQIVNGGQTKKLPTLRTVPVGTKNINAIDQNGERYSIKATSGNSTGVVYGLQPPGSKIEDKPVFEYIVICKLDEDYGLEGIYQLTWDNFIKYRKWHKTMKAWNLTLSVALKKDSVVIYEKENTVAEKKTPEPKKTKRPQIQKEETEAKKKIKAVSWSKTPKINHAAVRNEVVQRVSDSLGVRFTRESDSRYVSDDRETALYVMSSKYLEKNKEYWYSIDDDNLPWLELFKECYGDRVKLNRMRGKNGLADEDEATD